MSDRQSSEIPQTLDELCTRHRGVLQGEAEWLLAHGHDVRAARIVEVGELLERWQRKLSEAEARGPITDELVRL